MAKRRTLAEIDAELEVIRTSLLALDDKADEDTTDEDIARSTTELARFSELETERAARVAYDESIAAVRSLATAPGTTERPQAPEVIRRTDPYDTLEAVRGGYAPPSDMVARARQAVELAPRHMTDAAREQVTRMLENEDSRQTPLIARHMLLTGSEQYHDEFKEYIATRGAVVGQAMRAAMSLTDANGGYLVPFTLDPTIILTNAGIIDPIRSISRTITTATDTWSGVTSAGVTAEWLGEATAAADASPTFGQPTITPKKAAAWVQGSFEMLADSGFASELGPLLADAKARLEGAAFATANTAATKPVGVVTGVAAVTASIVTAATTNAFVVGDIYSVANSLRARDAANASWIANKAIFNKARQFDTSGSAAYWANLGMGTPQQLLGQPIYECSTMGSVVTTGANVLLAGDFSKYYIVDRVGMSVLYEPLVKTTASGGRPTGEAGWFAFWRVGADVVDPDAFRLLQLNTVAAATARA